MKQDKGRYDFSMDQRQVVLLISGVILVLMLSFLMGALFGKNVSATAGAPEVAKTDEAPTPPGAMDNVSSHEAGPAENADPDAAAADSPVSREAYLREIESMKLPTEALHPDTPASAMIETETPTLTSLSPEAMGAPKAGTDAAPSEAPGPPGGGAVIPAGAYTIQLASMPDKAEADQVVADLKGRLYDAYILEVTIPGKGAFYRVRVGHYSSLEQAKKALSIIQNREGKFFDAWITQ